MIIRESSAQIVKRWVILRVSCIPSALEEALKHHSNTFVVVRCKEPPKVEEGQGGADGFGNGAGDFGAATGGDNFGNRKCRFDVVTTTL